MLKDTYKTSHTLRTWLIFCSVVALLVVAPIVRTVQAQTPEPMAPAQGEAQVVQQQEQVPLPTEVPPPTPTPTPEPPPPTEVPLPTEVPTEVIVPTEVPTEVIVPTEVPTEVVVPTQIVTPEPTVVPTTAPTITPTASPTPTPTPAVKTRTSMQSAAVSATGAGTCTPPATTVVGAEVEVAWVCTSSGHPIKVAIAAPSAGWHYQTVIGSNPSAWQSGASVTEASGNINTVTIKLKATSSVLPGSTLTLPIMVGDPSFDPVTKPQKREYAFDLYATRTLGGENFQIVCNPATVAVATGATGTSTCTLSGINIAPSAQVSVSNIGVAMNPATGWTVSATPTSGSFTGATSFPFTVSLSPVCGAAVSPPSANVQITSSLSFMGSGFAGPGGAITAAHSATATTVNAWITGASMDWTKTYSLGPQSDTGSLSYRVEAIDGCAGWNVQLAATDFVYSGSANGSNIPAANFAVTASGAPTGASLTGVGRPTTSGTLNGSLKLLNATEGNGLGTYDHAVDLGITIPGGARVGTYTSTVTITAASGP